MAAEKHESGRRVARQIGHEKAWDQIKMLQSVWKKKLLELVRYLWLSLKNRSSWIWRPGALGVEYCKGSKQKAEMWAFRW